MNMNLNLYEIRVIGCLIEKAITTPDQYPLSINALTAACNQKSNRDPVLDLSENTVQEAVDSLIKKFQISRIQGGRVTKYQHRFCNSEFSSLQLSDKSVGIICELFLRGPQTPGELRTHADRLCPLKDVSEVEAELEKLMAHDEPLVVKLPREPGKRESRYAHLFSGLPELQTSVATQVEASEPGLTLQQRVDVLEQQVSDLQASLDELRQKISTIDS